MTAEQASLDFGDSLSAARRRVRMARFDTSGTICPCCDGLAKAYNRKFNKTMGDMLLQLFIWEKQEPGRWRHVKQEWPHNPGTFNQEYARMTDYELIEAPDEKRVDGNPHTGNHRITRKGVSFVMGLTAVPARLVYYKGSVIEESIEMINIAGVLGRPFNYRELWHTKDLFE